MLMLLFVSLGFEVRYTGTTRMGKQRWKKILRLSYRDVAEWWHGQILPKHFTPAGAREYKYTPRKGEQSGGGAFWRSYTGRKQKQWGHRNPLQWSGKFKLESRKKNIVARSTFARVRIVGRVLNLSRIPNSEINMRKEVSTVSTSERRKSLVIAGKSVERNLPKRGGVNRRVTISPF